MIHVDQSPKDAGKAAVALGGLFYSIRALTILHTAPPLAPRLKARFYFRACQSAHLIISPPFHLIAPSLAAVRTARHFALDDREPELLQKGIDCYSNSGSICSLNTSSSYNHCECLMPGTGLGMKW